MSKPQGPKTVSHDYYRSRPVRGNLEPQDSATASGWRYIQTTDTPDQLRVLLPPGTASMYEQLLKLEALELAKKSATSWQRVMEIRHLKDRMIHKCQKIAGVSASRKIGQGETFTLQTFAAPPEFRLKEMEKWFREQQQKRSPQPPRPQQQLQPPPPPPPITTSHSAINPNCCSRCAAAALAVAGSSSVVTHSFKDLHHRPATTAAPRVPPSPLEPSSSKLRRSNTVPNPEPMRTASTSRLPNSNKIQAPKMGASSSAPLPQPRTNITTQATSSMRAVSPPPLPHPYRGPMVADRDLTDVPSMSLVPFSQPPVEIPSTPSPTGDQGSASPVDDDTLQPISKNALRRRRSCIKRSNPGDLVKTVSWAADDQLAQFATMVRDNDSISGPKWEKIRAVYLDQLNGLETLSKDVARSLTYLKEQTVHLQQMDDLIRDHTQSLRSTLNAFEAKQVEFKNRVLGVLEEGRESETSDR